MRQNTSWKGPTQFKPVSGARVQTTSTSSVSQNQ